MALARAGRALLRCSAANPAATCQIQATLAGLYQAEAPLELLQAATDSGTASWLTTARVGLQRLPFRSSAAPLAGVEVEIQSMGESITEGSIAEILKSEGDSVAEDEVIAQIETDKVTIDIKAPVAGKLSELKVRGSAAPLPLFEPLRAPLRSHHFLLLDRSRLKTPSRSARWSR